MSMARAMHTADAATSTPLNSHVRNRASLPMAQGPVVTYSRYTTHATTTAGVAMPTRRAHRGPVSAASGRPLCMYDRPGILALVGVHTVIGEPNRHPWTLRATARRALGVLKI